MLKWVGRILYIFFVILVILFVEVMSGGVKGIQRSEYVRDHILEAYEKDGDIFEYLARYSAAIDVYFSDTAIKSQDNNDVYSNHGDTIDDDYKVSLSFYPFVSVLKESKLDLWYDGFHLVFNSYSDNITQYRIEIISAYNSLDENMENKVTLTNDTFLYVYLSGDGFFLNQRVPTTTYIINSMFYSDEQKDLYNSFEYDIKAIDIYAYPKIDEDSDEEVDENGVLIYRLTDGNINGLAGNPLSTNTNLKLNAEDYNISKLLDSKTPTEEELTTYSIVNTYNPADFSKYNFIYYIVYSVYFVVIVVIPYFMFFHKKVRAKIRQKRGKDEDATLVSQRPEEEQIFSDYVPPKDGK